MFSHRAAAIEKILTYLGLWGAHAHDVTRPHPPWIAGPCLGAAWYRGMRTVDAWVKDGNM